ncbi:DUF2461 domain-containing protein [Frigidibacter sp. RF13]|uniref:DUF2461 domain-containing protein n=1 Tax=Frigidibacter sp. RF13 TaxID=2997340 RepID=UPI002271E906|nr:DUF2461 domain-containing protein [Frigidibacter sp. RF13]MCY1125656.1 DUF2461 domain-containing protein [Frigidibacter sp. RF13]
MRYSGLPRETLAFLCDLRDNNDRTWFEAHRREYEQDWLAAGLDLIAALAPLCERMDPRLLAVPKLNQSLRRIHRDTRFSKDKSPYQPWLHLILSTGPEFNKVPGMHIVLTPGGLGYGAGHYGLDPAALERMRARICDAKDRGALLSALDEAEKVGSTLDTPDLARTPKGYQTAPDWDHLLRRKSLIARTQANSVPPDWLFTPDAPERLAKIARAHLPLLAWLTRPT